MLDLVFCLILFASGHTRQYSVLLDCRNEHGQLHVPDLSQAVLGPV